MRENLLKRIAEVVEQKDSLTQGEISAKIKKILEDYPLIALTHTEVETGLKDHRKHTVVIFNEGTHEAIQVTIEFFEENGEQMEQITTEVVELNYVARPDSAIHNRVTKDLARRFSIAMQNEKKDLH